MATPNARFRRCASPRAHCGVLNVRLVRQGARALNSGVGRRHADPQELDMAERAEHKGAGHRGRLRERFLAAGLGAFADYEVIELLLTLGTPRRDCKDAAKALLRRFKTLQGVLEASASELQEVPGVGPKNAIGLR